MLTRHEHNVRAVRVTNNAVRIAADQLARRDITVPPRRTLPQAGLDSGYSVCGASDHGLVLAGDVVAIVRALAE